MELRNRIQENIAEDSGETVKILVLQPRAAGPFKVKNCKTVVAIPQERRQVKISRRKSVSPYPT